MSRETWREPAWWERRERKQGVKSEKFRSKSKENWKDRKRKSGLRDYGLRGLR